MTSFRTSDINLRIAVKPGELEAYALAALDVLIPRYAGKVYFIRAEDERRYPRIEQRAAAAGNVSLLHHDDRPWNLRKKFKLMDCGEFLHIAASFDRRVLRSEWQKIYRMIEAGTSKYA